MIAHRRAAEAQRRSFLFVRCPGQTKVSPLEGQFMAEGLEFCRIPLIAGFYKETFLCELCASNESLGRVGGEARC